MAGHNLHTSVSLAETVAADLRAWCKARDVSANAVIGRAMAEWSEHPRDVQVEPGPRRRVGVRLNFVLIGRARQAAEDRSVGMNAVLDTVVAGIVRSRPKVTDPRRLPPPA